MLVTGDVPQGADPAAKPRSGCASTSQTVVANALPDGAVKTLLDCFVIDDPKCSRGLVDARATTDSFVSIRIDVVSKKDNATSG